MRRVFLWAARNRWLKDHLPRLGFMRRAVRRFMPGETMDDALTAAAPLQAAGIGTMYTRLGENLESLAEADEVVAHYLTLIERIKAAGIDGEISVKPTQLGLDDDPDVCLAHLVRLAEARAGVGSYLWIDMEGSAYTDATIVLYERLARDAAADRHLPPGVPAPDGRGHRSAAAAGPGDPPRQGRLRRAGRDRLSRQARGRCQLRRAGGPVPAGHARDDRTAGARHARRGPHRADRPSVAPAGVARDGFEVEMLYGIRTGEQFRLAKAGYRVQTLIAYGEHWYPWYMRRLAERPANVTFAIRSLLP